MAEPHKNLVLLFFFVVLTITLSEGGFCTQSRPKAFYFFDRVSGLEEEFGILKKRIKFSPGLETRF